VRLTKADIISVQVKSIAFAEEEVQQGVQALFTGARPIEEMVTADAQNPKPLPAELVQNLSKYALDDLATAIHRPETPLNIVSPLTQQYFLFDDSFRHFSFSNFRFCFAVPDDCSLDISPMVVEPSSEFPYHGIALGLRRTQFSSLSSLKSAETALLESLPRFGRRGTNTGLPSPNLNINLKKIEAQGVKQEGGRDAKELQE
jgi:hypothetical protein